MAVDEEQSNDGWIAKLVKKTQPRKARVSLPGLPTATLASESQHAITRPVNIPSLVLYLSSQAV